MPVVAIIGAIAGEALAGALVAEGVIGATIGGIAAGTIGSVVGSGLASGVYADAMGGNFGQGFMSGAVGAGVGAAFNGVFGTPASMSESAFQAADAASLAGTTDAFGNTLSPTAIMQNTDAAGFGEFNSFAPQNIGMGDIGTQTQALNPAVGNTAAGFTGEVTGIDGSVTPYQVGGLSPQTTDMGGSNVYDPGNLATMENVLPQGPTVPTKLGDMYQSSSPSWSQTNLNSAPLEGTDNAWGVGKVSTSGETPMGLEGITAPSAPIVEKSIIATPETSGRSIGDFFSDVGDRMTTKVKDMFAPTNKMDQLKLGIGITGGLSDMYAANQAANAYKKNLAEFQSNMNNPQIGYNNWMQGEGGDQLAQAQAKAAATGHTNMAPMLRTQTLRDWYSKGYPQYMQMQGAATGQANKIADYRFYGNTAPFRNLSQMYGFNQKQAGK